MNDSRNLQHDFNQFVGSAVVSGASYRQRTTILQLQTFAGERLDCALGDVPDLAGAADFAGNALRPISVIIQQGGERCSVIGLTSRGPRRRNVTLGTALALHQSGVHTVVEGGLQKRASCAPPAVLRV